MIRYDEFLKLKGARPHLPDVPAPLKPHVFVEIGTPGRTCMISWSTLESKHVDAVMESLGLAYLRRLIDSPEVKRMDGAMLAAEKRDLMRPEPEDWRLTEEPAFAYTIVPWSAEQASEEFRVEYFRLLGSMSDSRAR